MVYYTTKDKFYYSDLINDHQFLSGFGTRNMSNLKTIFPNYPIIKIIQKHRNKVLLIDQNNFNKKKYISDGDGIVTRLKNIILTIKTADCLPIVYVDKKTGIIGISHNGWQGSYMNICQKIVAAFASQESKPKDILVTFGPAICKNCYNINPKRADMFIKKYKNYQNSIFYKNNQAYLNLIKLNYNILIDLGLKKENIDVCYFCTKCQTNLFYSYRKNKEYKRMTNFVLLKQ